MAFASLGIVKVNPLATQEFNTSDLKSQMDMKKQLQNLKELPDRDDEQVKQLMTDAYYLLRKDVTSGMPVVELNEQWPLLLDYKCLTEHFYMLTEVNPVSAFEESLIGRNKGSRIYDYILSGSQKKKGEDLKHWMSLIKAEVDDTKSTKPQLQGVFFLLVNYFEEKEDQLFRFYGVCITNNGIYMYKIVYTRYFTIIFQYKENI